VWDQGTRHLSILEMRTASEALPADSSAFQWREPDIHGAAPPPRTGPGPRSALAPSGSLARLGRAPPELQPARVGQAEGEDAKSRADGCPAEVQECVLLLRRVSAQDTL